MRPGVECRRSSAGTRNHHDAVGSHVRPATGSMSVVTVSSATSQRTPVTQRSYDMVVRLVGRFPTAFKDGKAVESSEANLAELNRQATEFAEKRLPILKALQIA